jgi:hypothetical protein|nr:MAG TPA: hypothetical protein [Caudoviricetes sp.]
MALIISIIVFGLLVHVGWRELKRKFRAFAKDVLAEDEEVERPVKPQAPRRATTLEEDIGDNHTITMSKAELEELLKEAVEMGVEKAQRNQ